MKFGIKNRDCPSKIGTVGTYASIPIFLYSVVRRGIERQTNTEQKFNLVIHGVFECAANTPRHCRLSEDTDQAVSVLSITSENISSHSIRDCMRLSQQASTL